MLQLDARAITYQKRLLNTLETMDVGERLFYHRGRYLPKHMHDATYCLYLLGLVTFVQKRVGDYSGLFDYVLVKCADLYKGYDKDLKNVLKCL